MQCNNCNKDIPDDSKFCRYCGSQLQVNPNQIESAKTVDEIKPKSSESSDIKSDKVVYNSKSILERVSKKTLLFSAITLSGFLIILILIATLFQFHNSNFVATFNSINKNDSDTLIPIEKLSFESSNLTLSIGEKKKLNLNIYPQTAQIEELVWTSDNSDVISVNNSGLITALEPNSSATITVKLANDESIQAKCKVNVISEEDAFFETVNWINTNQMKIEKINLYENNFVPNKRDSTLVWNDTIFYSLEDIDSEDDTDGKINSYNLERKQLINSDTGNLIEYEIYINPINHDINKIVSIEYKEDKLEILDYYYIDGSPNFIFERVDNVYTPTYASQDKVGNRYYFENDVLIKWRVIDEPRQVKDYCLNKYESQQIAYDSLSDNLKKEYDKKENMMLNAAYNTYNKVLQSKNISYIKGYVTDINGMPIENAIVKVFSNQYEALISEYITSTDGYYNAAVPSNKGTYMIKIEKPNYKSTNIYDIKVDNQTLGIYQENVYLVNNNSQNYNLTLILNDALNKIDDSYYYDDYYYYYGNTMKRIENAQLIVREGINNRYGQIYTSQYADEYGIVNLYLPAGNYTGEIVKQDYETSYFTINSRKQNDFIQTNTTPILSEDELRIVLTWSDNPKDLDSHLFTPYQGDSGDMQHIGYYEKSDMYGNNLDVDDVDGYGPETVTIKNLNDGNYKYFVSDFSNCIDGNYNSYEMSFSNAKVSIYTKDGLVQIFNVPYNKNGVIWEVFEIRNKTIIPIQRYYNNISDKPWWNSMK